MERRSSNFQQAAGHSYPASITIITIMIMIIIIIATIMSIIIVDINIIIALLTSLLFLMKQKLTCNPILE